MHNVYAKRITYGWLYLNEVGRVYGFGLVSAVFPFSFGNYTTFHATSHDDYC